MSSMLIYGAAGFVGTALTEQLIPEHAERVVLVDRRPIVESVHHNLKAKGIEVLEQRADALCLLDLAVDIDAAVVLAGQANVDEALAYPSRALEQNIHIAVEVGEWLRCRPQTKLFYLSTDEVLGESSVPLPETAEYRPTQPYATSKAAAEMVLHCFRDTYSLNIVTIRSCNLVGGHQRAAKLIPIAVTHLVRREEVPVFGSGRQTREWLAVEDLCSAILTLVSEAASTGIYNCSSGTSRAVLDVIRVVARAVDADLRFRHVPDRLVQDSSYAMNCGRLQALGWSPQHQVDDAIARAATTMKDALEAGECLVGSDVLVWSK
jgi:dTDP-glucose 4,6-dehydratase